MKNTEKYGIKRFVPMPAKAVCLICACLLTGVLAGNAGPAWSKPSRDSGPDAVTAIIPYDAPPTYFLDKKTNKPSGFAVEIMDRVAKRAGLQLEYIYGDSWADIFVKVRKGEADLIPHLGLSDERKKQFAYTTVLDAFPVSFFVRAQQNVALRKDAVVGVIAESLAFEKLRNRPDIQLVTYEGFGQGLFDLLSGQIDSFACPEPTLMRLARESGVEDRIRTTGKPLGEIKRAIAVRREDTELLARLNKALDGFVGSPEYRRLYVKWYGKPTPYWTPARIIILSAVLGAMIAGTMAIWRYRSMLRLNKELKENIAGRKRVEEEREKLILDLQSALTEVKTLSGMLPICSSCKKIRDDQGYWNQLESYISKHSEAEFSHGLCPDCAHTLYPDYRKKKK